MSGQLVATPRAESARLAPRCHQLLCSFSWNLYPNMSPRLNLSLSGVDTSFSHLVYPWHLLCPTTSMRQDFLLSTQINHFSHYWHFIFWLMSILCLQCWIPILIKTSSCQTCYHTFFICLILTTWPNINFSGCRFSY